MRNAWLLCLGGLWACGSTESNSSEAPLHDAAPSITETSTSSMDMDTGACQSQRTPALR